MVSRQRDDEAVVDSTTIETTTQTKTETRTETKTMARDGSRANGSGNGSAAEGKNVSILDRAKRVPLAVWIWLLYTAVVAGAVWYVFVQGDIGVDTSTKQEFNDTGAVTATTTTEDHSTFVLGVLAALAGGGWAIIPLKYLWDELGKTADDRRSAAQKKLDAERAERSLVNSDRRATASKMRDLVFAGVTEHFGPMLYRQQSIIGWTNRCLDTKAGAQPPTSRLLFALGALEATLDGLRIAGRPLLLKSIEKEQDASAKARELQSYTYELLGHGDGCDVLLLRAVTDGKQKDEKVVSYAKFESRLTSNGHDWVELGSLAATFKTNCKEDALKQLLDRATLAYDSLRDGLNQVYDDWYQKSDPGA